MVDFSIYDQKQPEVSALQCPTCKTIYYPAPMVCTKCFTRRDPSEVFFSSWDKVAVQGNCKLLAWTRVWALPEGYNVKYLLFGIVEFESGMRASVRLDVDEPRTGMALYAEAGVTTERSGKEVYGLFARAR
jgi:uncharacterized protein